MTTAQITMAALELPPEDLLEHWDAVWQRIASQFEFELRPEIRAKLVERLSEASSNPDGGVSVAAVHRNIRERLASSRG